MDLTRSVLARPRGARDQAMPTCLRFGMSCSTKFGTVVQPTSAKLIKTACELLILSQLSADACSIARKANPWSPGRAVAYGQRMVIRTYLQMFLVQLKYLSLNRGHAQTQHLDRALTVHRESGWRLTTQLPQVDTAALLTDKGKNAQD